MAKRVFALHFTAPRKDKDRPFTPNARIAVKNFVQDTADGLPFIGAGARFEKLDRVVDDLIRDLKRIRKEARRRFEDFDNQRKKREKRKTRKGK
jgi:hypothetical protein